MKNLAEIIFIILFSCLVVFAVWCISSEDNIDLVTKKFESVFSLDNN